MAISIPDRVVVFDYGEVISLSPSESDKAALLGTAGVTAGDIERFWASYWKHRDDLDEGTVTIVDYWHRVARDLGLTWGPAQLQQLWIDDFRGWFSADAATIALLDELHVGGTRMALLSNAGFDFTGPFGSAPTARYFERIFVSAELGVAKPDPAIYRHVADALGIGFGQFVFVDNKSVNVDAAVALGATGHVFTGAAELRDFLRALGSDSSGA